MDQKDLIIKKTFTIAYQNHQKSNFKVAENLYKKILKIDPHHFESIFFLGTLSTQFRKFNMAIKCFHFCSGNSISNFYFIKAISSLK